MQLLFSFVHKNPINTDVYTEHANEVISACYAPSGFYICSGGTVFLTTNA